MILEEQIMEKLTAIERLLEAIAGDRGKLWVRQGEARRRLGCGRTKFYEDYLPKIRRKLFGREWKYNVADIDALAAAAPVELAGEKIVPEKRPMRKMNIQLRTRHVSGHSTSKAQRPPRKNQLADGIRSGVAENRINNLKGAAMAVKVMAGM